MDEEADRIRRLQNGSDIRGVAVEGEKGRPVDLTPPAVEAIAESFGEWVRDGLEREGGATAAEVRVSLGRDPRISGSVLSVAVFAGLSRAGCVGFDMGLATTPACFMSTVLPPFSFDASIMVLSLSLSLNFKISKFIWRDMYSLNEMISPVLIKIELLDEIELFGTDDGVALALHSQWVEILHEKGRVNVIGRGGDMRESGSEIREPVGESVDGA